MTQPMNKVFMFITAAANGYVREYMESNRTTFQWVQNVADIYNQHHQAVASIVKNVIQPLALNREFDSINVHPQWSRKYYIEVHVFACFI